MLGVLHFSRAAHFVSGCFLGLLEAQDVMANLVRSVEP